MARTVRNLRMVLFFVLWLPFLVLTPFSPCPVADQAVMQNVLFFLGAGILAGFLLRKKTFLLDFSDKAASWAVYILLFTLGLGTGLNPEILSAMGLSGLYALILSLLAVAGSILLVSPVYFLYFRKKSDPDTKGNPHGQP